VMYLGQIVESGTAQVVCGAPKHPYTRALMSLAPRLDTGSQTRVVLAGEMPSPIDPPAGCPFHPRCPIAEARCKTDVPAWRELCDGHWVACHLAH
jgi:oligopeptide/dipeptide ABC transporter ATP-binding protein